MIFVGSVLGLILRCWKKWGVIDKAMVYAPLLIHKVLDCALCLSFWASVIVSGALFFFIDFSFQDFFITWAIAFVIYK